MKRSPTTAAWAIALALPALLGAAAAAAEQLTLTVLFTSDVHANVLPTDEVRQRPNRGSLAQVATIVERVRSENPRTVVLDGGDAIQGTPLGYYAIAAPGGSGVDPTIAAMNVIGYDAAAIGNHEFNFGLQVLARSLSQSRFPWLAANLGGAAEAELQIGDDVVVERGGVRVGVLGLTNPNVPGWDPPAHWRGLSFRDPVETARARLVKLRARADVVIVVAHTGFERDLDDDRPDGTGHENFASRLAALDGIDVLLTGHTHRHIQPRLLGRTIVAQPGRWAEHVSRIDLTLERGERGWAVTGWRGESLPTAAETASERVEAAVRAEQQRTVAELSRPLAELETPLIVGGVPTRDDPAVDVMHAMQLEASGAQLSLAAPLAGSRTTFPAGVITPRLAHALCPYPNTLVVVRLTGAELLDVLEHAVRGWQGLECAPATGCALARDPRMPFYNYDSLEGASYLVDLSAPAGRRVRGLRVGGRLVAPDDGFTVVINSYRASGGGAYPHLATAPRVREIGRPVVELLVAHLATRGRLSPTASDNWAFIVPLEERVAAAGAAAR